MTQAQTAAAHTTANTVASDPITITSVKNKKSAITTMAETDQTQAAATEAVAHTTAKIIVASDPTISTVEPIRLSAKVPAHTETNMLALNPTTFTVHKMV